MDQDIGVGFYLDKSESNSYLLSPRGTTNIKLSVISSMWGHYKDLLNLQVTILNLGLMLYIII